MRHGPVTLYTAFRPATEVGGDYFDLFPLGRERLLVAIGDVAGHGLSTGLLMASLKALLAALADEGYRGSELIGRVNDVFRAQRPERTMATSRHSSPVSCRRQVRTPLTSPSGTVRVTG